MPKFQPSYFFLEMSTKHILKFTSERFVLSKTCPRTITLTFKSECIICVHAITHIPP